MISGRGPRADGQAAVGIMQGVAEQLVEAGFPGTVPWQVQGTSRPAERAIRAGVLLSWARKGRCANAEFFR
jgi:hypothetical protein